jgi:glycosyltransferase involved in cell wall biosynthesis
VDDWSRFENLDGAWLAEKEQALLCRADVVFAVSRWMEKKCRQTAGDRVHYVPHGVDVALFGRALDTTTPVPGELAGLPHPIVGFYGNVSAWIDFALIEQLAKKRTDWTFVLIGPILCDIASLRALPNVRFLGRREHVQLPDYCRGFDVGIIPYDMTHPRMESVNPVKTRELLAAGVPLAASKIPELQEMGNPDIALCANDAEWETAIERQAARRDREAIAGRMRGEDWTAKAALMRRIVESVEHSQELPRGA